MELRQLEYFVAVAEESGFTRAAERVHISQSGVSAQIRQLERELGAVLVDRSGRTVTLTAAGAAALQPARTALAAAAAVRAAVDDVSGLVRGSLVVGMVVACTVTPLFEALAAFHGARPGVEIELVEDNSDRLVDRVRSGTADLALVATAAAAPDGLEALVIVSDRLVAAAPAGHLLLELPRVTLADVCAHSLVCLPEGTGIRTVLDQACASAGLHPRIGFQASAPGAAADLALRGLGVAILSESMVADGDPLQAIPIDDVDAPAVLALVWRPVHTPAVRELLVHARSTFAR